EKTAKYAAALTAAATLAISFAIGSQIAQNKERMQVSAARKSEAAKVVKNNSSNLQKFLKRGDPKNSISTADRQVKTSNADAKMQARGRARRATGIPGMLEKSAIEALLAVIAGIGLAEFRLASIKHISRWLDKVYSSGKH
ncbi:MAG: hypothetical protein M1331_01180, partial [Candidatus Marsarchaeota archaeon]|nr:hypothetical protein [Candidatus Marsarchaeota archaeon]